MCVRDNREIEKQRNNQAGHHLRSIGAMFTSNIDKRGGQDTESAKAKEERDEEGGERELGPGKDAEFRESQETMRWQEMKNL